MKLNVKKYETKCLFTVVSLIRKTFGDIEFKRSEGKNVHIFYLSES